MTNFGGNMTRKTWYPGTVALAVLMGFFLITAVGQVMGTVFTWQGDWSKGPHGSSLGGKLQEYDGIVVGCGYPSTLDLAALEDHIGGPVYNAVTNTTDMDQIVATARSVVNNYSPDHLFLVVNLPDKQNRSALGNPRYRGSNKECLDVENLGTLSQYVAKNPVFASQNTSPLFLSETQKTLDGVTELVKLCKIQKVQLTVMTAPVPQVQLNRIIQGSLGRFLENLAEITSFWDFTSSSVSGEPRYFYDELHFRPAVGTMMAAKITGDTGSFVPSDFGVYRTAESHKSTTGSQAPLETKIPILTYHNFAQVGDGYMTMSISKFEAQIAALAKNGYQAIDFDQLIAHVEQGTPLPQKPVIITIDDGYLSNYTLAYPVLKKYNMKATIFVIGSSVGKSQYKDTFHSIVPHFSYEQAKEMMNSGLISIESHTHDMHQWQAFEGNVARPNVAQLPGETDLAYGMALQADFAKSRQDLANNLGVSTLVLAYPLGKITDAAALAAKAQNFPVTLSTEPMVATVVKGQPQSLYGLPRMAMYDTITPQAMLAKISQ